MVHSGFQHPYSRPWQGASRSTTDGAHAFALLALWGCTWLTFTLGMLQASPLPLP